MPSPYDTDDPLHPEQLKGKQRSLRDGFALPLTLRVHRALSWLRRAEAEEVDLDVRFILLWIGFNAAYAGDLDRALEGHGRAGGERERFDQFFATLVDMDRGNRIYNAIWERFSQEIRLLLDNKFVFAPFWRHQAGEFGGAGWEELRKRTRRGQPRSRGAEHAGHPLDLVRSALCASQPDGPRRCYLGQQRKP